MARKKIREYDSKRLIKAHIQRIAGLQLPINVAQVKENTNFSELLAMNPWMTQVSAAIPAQYDLFNVPYCFVTQIGVVRSPGSLQGVFRPGAALLVAQSNWLSSVSACCR